MTNSALRAQLRPHGILSEGCRECHFLTLCGGIEPERGLLNCFDLCLYSCGNCDNVCPKRSDFFRCLLEIGGLRYDHKISIIQKQLDLPMYVPMIHHGSNRTQNLAMPYAAVDTYGLFHIVDGSYRCVVDSPSALRKRYRLAPKTKIILRGTHQDKFLEQFWSYRRRDGAAAQLAKLNVCLAIGPNFSHFLDVPRTDNLYNRKRQLICLAEFQQAGISPVPHLNAVTTGDWNFWKHYLEQNEEIMYVSAEFQTGNRNRTEGRTVIDHLAWLQEQLRRVLHPVVVGGTQFAKYFAERFNQFTLIDSKPFINTIWRKKLHLEGNTSPKENWITSKTQSCEPLDELLRHNLQYHSAFLSKLCENTHWALSRDASYASSKRPSCNTAQTKRPSRITTRPILPKIPANLSESVI